MNPNLYEVFFDKGFPLPGKVEAFRSAEVFQRAVTAYRFWYPTVSADSLMTGLLEQGLRANEVLGHIDGIPAGRLLTPCLDTPFALGVLDLREGPLVIELPPGPFVASVNDHHQRWVMDLGLSTPAGERGGKYLLLPPGYQGIIPSGYKFAISGSFLNILTLRILTCSTVTGEATERLKLCRVYPLASVKNPRSSSFVDLCPKKFDLTPLRLEDDIDFWFRLKEIIDLEPALDGYRGMLGLLGSLGIEKGVEFRPDELDKKLLLEAGNEAKAQLLISAFASDRPDRIVWNNRKWEWPSLVVDDGNFEGEDGIDLEARDRWFALTVNASPSMFGRSEGNISCCWLSHRDGAGSYLDGGKTYRLSVPGPVPAKVCWSVTAFESASRCLIENDQKKAIFRSHIELRDATDLSRFDLFFGPLVPAGQEDRWIQTTPGKGWFAFFRLHCPDQDAFNGNWQPGDFEEIYSTVIQ